MSETVTWSGPEYIERQMVITALEKQRSIDSQPRAIKRAIRIVRELPKAYVKELYETPGEKL